MAGPPLDVASGRGGVPLATGFVLIRTKPRMEREVYEGLRKIPHVEELYNVFGDCDIVAKVIARDYQALGDVVVNIIRSSKGIIWTKTLVTVKL